MPYADGIDADCIQEAGEYMRHATFPFITPISRVIEHDYGEVHGSATILSLCGRPYLLTCEHVAVQMEKSRLAHFTSNREAAAAVVNPFQCMAFPVDSAISRIDDDMFQLMDKQALPAARIATRFAPAEGEIIFVHGYPGERGRFSALFGGIRAKTFPYATDVTSLPPGFSESSFFALSFPDDIWRFDGNIEIRPNPKGLSGSAVWNTKYVASGTAGWEPDQSDIIGILHGYNEEYQCLVGVKIEIVRAFLLTALRHEAAYFRWRERNELTGNSLTDWLWAETKITDVY